MRFFSKIIRNRYILVIDIFFSVVAVLGSYVIRLELIDMFPTYIASALWMLGISILVIKPLIYYFFGIYRKVWQYASIRELVLISPPRLQLPR